MTQSIATRDAQITLRDFLMVIFRRKWIILSMVAVTTAVVFSALMMAPVFYVSSAKMLIWGAQSGGPIDRARIVLDWEQVLSSECELITSKPILERAQSILDEQAANGQPRVIAMANRVRPTPVQKSRVLVLSYSGSQPDESQRVCQAVTDAYMEYHKTLFAPPDPGMFFQSEMQKTEDRLVDLMNKKLEVKEANDVVDVGSEMQSLFAVLTNYKINLVEVERKIATISSELAQSEEAGRAGRSAMPYSVEPTGAEFESIRYLLQEQSRRRIEREQLLTMYTERHPEVERVTNQMREIDANIALQVGEVTAHKKSELLSHQAERDLIRQRIVETEDRLRVLPLAERDINEAQQGIDNATKHAGNLIYMRAQAASTMPSPADYHVALLSSPGYGAPSNPRDLVRMTLGPLLSLLVGIGLAFFFDNLDHSLKNPEEVERYLGLPVLTSIKRRSTRELSI